MRIRRIKPVKLRYTPEKGLADGLAPIASRDVFLVQIETDEGITGIGEGFALGSLHSMETILEETVAPLVVGEDPFATARLWEKVYHFTYRYGRRGIVMAVLSAVDIALWDIVGKATGTPVYKLLGGSCNRVPAYASGGYYMPGKGLAELAREARTYKELGFGAMKMKIGAASWQEDVARVQAVREAVGPEMKLAVDANNAYDLNAAVRMARLLEPFDLYFFEEPLSGDCLEDSVRLAETTDIPIAGYETELTRFALRDFITRRAVDIVQTDAIWAGGLTETRNIAVLASAWKMSCIPHFSAAAVSLAANLHLAAAMPNIPIIELTLDENPLRDELALEPIERVGGELLVPERPGLGIELNLDVVNKYLVQ
ncbi:MAG TPA: mandelate racemase/muconate lactonizing enzyme family protein [Firmicutes bacterium]|uniref:mandelate racemase/muconate lactonizing enzyme family protein n=1 Tax=Gelria sp. Kuro-4 TaxID=2796927 RepID=UPI0019A92E0E|nr:mandelate racemase/muconate lactonizing enzyme family protein [Gelria sp. Kuro-4]BCV24610.1 mandelate racemase [Gelria sp. Kuro-4]HHV58233.1 mandelate racemase/muconate lactonizing enzyme family protein [Bacillota bacterium]